MKILALFKDFIIEEKAQVTIEYVLTLTMIIGVTLGILVNFREVIQEFWNAIIYKVSKGCPNCP